MTVFFWGSLHSHYICLQELENKWEGGHIQNWVMVMNQLPLHENLKGRALKYME